MEKEKIEIFNINMGNLFEIESMSIPFRVDSIEWDTSNYNYIVRMIIPTKPDLSYVVAPIKFLKPIRITPDWLRKFRFIKVGCVGGGGQYWKGEHMDLTDELELSTSNRDYDTQSVDGSQKFLFVHQLQNIHLSFTGHILIL